MKRIVLFPGNQGMDCQGNGLNFGENGEQVVHQPALARHAELRFEIAADARDDLDAVLLHRTYLVGDRARGRGEIKRLAAAIVTAAATFCNFISASSG